MSADGPVLVDSSVWIECFRPDGEEACRRETAALLIAGRAVTCEVVLAEVLRGAMTPAAWEAMSSRMGSVSRLSMDGMGSLAGSLARQLEAKGLTLPTTDLLIAAVAQSHGAAILHRDRHLSRAAEIIGLPEHSLKSGE